MCDTSFTRGQIAGSPLGVLQGGAPGAATLQTAMKDGTVLKTQVMPQVQAGQTVTTVLPPKKPGDSPGKGCLDVAGNFEEFKLKSLCDQKWLVGLHQLSSRIMIGKRAVPTAGQKIWA